MFLAVVKRSGRSALQMKDSQLLPYILPNVFAISRVLSPTQFAALVLPSLKPLFAIKDPPQNMLTLLSNVKVLQDKTEKPVFLERACYSRLNVGPRVEVF